jgi:hypothetical protein
MHPDTVVPLERGGSVRGDVDPSRIRRRASRALCSENSDQEFVAITLAEFRSTLAPVHARELELDRGAT